MSIKNTKTKIVTEFLNKLKGIEINSIPLIKGVNNTVIIINDDIELDDLNSYLRYNKAPTVESFTDFIHRSYALTGPKLIKDALDYPQNEKVVNVPPISLTPSKDNPKVIKIMF